VFCTVATVIGEAEASILLILTRHRAKAAAFWVKVRTLPQTNPLARLHTDGYKRFRSPLQRISGSLHRFPKAIERIQPYTLAPWEARIQLHITDGDALIPEGIQFVTSLSARNRMVGLGFAFRGNKPFSTHKDARTSDRAEQIHSRAGRRSNGGDPHTRARSPHGDHDIN
jgi:hypothetical protein